MKAVAKVLKSTVKKPESPLAECNSCISKSIEREHQLNPQQDLQKLPPPYYPLMTVIMPYKSKYLMAFFSFVPRLYYYK